MLIGAEPRALNNNDEVTPHRQGNTLYTSRQLKLHSAAHGNGSNGGTLRLALTQLKH